MTQSLSSPGFLETALPCDNPPPLLLTVLHPKTVTVGLLVSFSATIGASCLEFGAVFSRFGVGATWTMLCVGAILGFVSNRLLLLLPHDSYEEAASELLPASSAVISLVVILFSIGSAAAQITGALDILTTLAPIDWQGVEYRHALAALLCIFSLLLIVNERKFHTIIPWVSAIGVGVLGLVQLGTLTSQEPQTAMTSFTTTTAVVQTESLRSLAEAVSLTLFSFTSHVTTLGLRKRTENMSMSLAGSVVMVMITNAALGWSSAELCPTSTQAYCSVTAVASSQHRWWWWKCVCSSAEIACCAALLCTLPLNLQPAIDTMMRHTAATNENPRRIIITCGAMTITSALVMIGVGENAVRLMSLLGCTLSILVTFTIPSIFVITYAAKHHAETTPLLPSYRRYRTHQPQRNIDRCWLWLAWFMLIMSVIGGALLTNLAW